MKSTHKADIEIRALRRDSLLKNIKGTALLIAWFIVGWGLEYMDDARLLAGLLWLSIFANGVLWLVLNDALTRTRMR